jgi:hypothetical protein
VQGFTPINANDMVDPATGDFSYNIPLLNVGDYPINLGYHAGVTMDEEASWVGLGWNLNPGVINHDVRGLPDDFDGSTTEKDEIREEVTMRPNETRGGSLTFAAEIVGLDVAKLQKALGVGAALTIGARFNNYSGLGLSVGYDQSMSLKLGHGHKLTAGIGRSADSRNGIGISPSLGYSYSKDMKTATDADGNVHSTTGCAGLRLSSTYNSRAGLTALSISPSISASSSKLESMKTSEMINNPFGTASWSQTGYSYSPSIEFPMKNSSGTYHLAIGSEAVWAAYMVKATYNWSKQELETNEIIAPAFGFLNAEKANGHANALMDMNREQDGTYTKNRPHLAIPVATNDIYNVQGQGVSGQYQLRRGDIGILGDAYRYNSADDKSGGVDYTIGSEFKAGADISISSSISTNDRWDFSHFFSYRGSVTNNKFYEKAYFKNAGEKNILDESFFKKIGEWSAARIAR